METEENSIRALKCEQSVLSRADGSVMFSQGKFRFVTFSTLFSLCYFVQVDKLYFIDLSFQEILW
jgi:DNA-binding Xre family transcriptional regulator